MAGVEARDFGTPDETRTPDKTKIDIVRMGGGTTAGRFTFEPGVIEPGHDASVVGDEPFVGFEFESRSAEEYAKGLGAGARLFHGRCYAAPRGIVAPRSRSQRV